MIRYHYFKITFLSVSAGLFTAMLVYGLFDVDFSNKDAIIHLILKSLATAVITGAILGLLNMFFKIDRIKI